MTFSKLGTDVDTGQIVELSQASRRQGLYIIGANGTGKTGLIEHLILQDIDQGLGVGLLDPHGDLVNAILAKMTKREDDVILLDIQDEDHPFGVNIFECSNPQSPTAVQKIVDLVMHIFEKLYDVSRAGTPLLLDYLRNCTYTLVANPGYTMADIPLLFTDQQCRQKLLAHISEPYVQLFWQQYEQLPLKEQRDEAASTMRRVREFLQPLSRNIVGQAQTTVNMQHIMDERKILLVKLSAQLDQVTSLIGSVIIAMILNAAYSRASLPVNKRKQFNLYADEFQRFATEDFATLLTEARKFGIATTIAHQARYQPGMTDGIRAVSLQAANQVVFRVTSPDADELAGGFDITPQAAWEEEIAKEWVEILKPEWYERVEEEVIDGEEEIKTPVKDVVGHLLRSGSHSNPVVNQFAHGTLQKFEAKAKEDEKRHYMRWRDALSSLNKLLYDTMVNKTISQLPPFSLLIDLAAVKGDISLHKSNGEIYFSFVEPLQQTPYQQGHFTPWNYQAARTAVTSLWTEPSGSYRYRQAESFLDTLARTFLRELKLYSLHHELDMIERDFTSYHTSIPRYITDPFYKSPQSLVPPHEWFQQCGMYPSSPLSRDFTESWFRLDPINFYQAWQEVPYVENGVTKTKWQLVPGLINQCYDPVALAQAVETNLQEDKAIFLAVLHELKAVMQALATQPIEVGSGLTRPRKRKQINYHTHPAQTLTHPRKVIMHPQRAYQDVKNDIANQLSGFPNFTARVKLSEILSHNPGKKCLNCKQQSKSGNKFCAKCGKKLPVANEYTVTTLKPLGGLGKAALQQRLITIQANNLQKGYVRDRTKVEAEILQRQQSCSGAPPAQPHPQKQPSPQPQQRHARQVPVQGKCPKCGAVNSSHAKFCNQCGMKL